MSNFKKNTLFLPNLHHILHGLLGSFLIYEFYSLSNIPGVSFIFCLVPLILIIAILIFQNPNFNLEKLNQKLFVITLTDNDKQELIQFVKNNSLLPIFANSNQVDQFQIINLKALTQHDVDNSLSAIVENAKNVLDRLENMITNSRG